MGHIPETFKTAEPRATIIVDTSALLQMAHPIDPYFCARPLHEHTYLDMLKLLGRKGFKIVIPEIISIESGEVLATGMAMSKKFKGGSGRHDEHDIVIPFLKDVIRQSDDTKGISVERCNHPEEVGDFVGGIL